MNLTQRQDVGQYIILLSQEQLTFYLVFSFAKNNFISFARNLINHYIDHCWHLGRCLPVSVSVCQCLTVPAHACQCLTVPARACQCLTVPARA